MSQQANDSSSELRSDDGKVSFKLIKAPAGLFVKRECRPDTRTRLIHCAVFKERSRFELWCEGDPMRFVYPRLSRDLRRQGRELLIEDV